MDTKNLALIIGNSDGIGLGLTRRLLDLGWRVKGLSRSFSPLEHQCYDHEIADAASDEFPELLAKAAAAKPDLCVYCPGIGEELNLDRLEHERIVFEVNLMGAVKMFAAVLPMMIGRGSGQILVLSSLADGMLSPEAPSYSASKAGLSSYVESVALAVRDRGVDVTNIRFGFVDTKMAKGNSRPFMMTVDKAVGYLLHCIEKRPVRFSRPRIMVALVCLVGWILRLKR